MANVTPGFELIQTKNSVLLDDVRNLLNSLWSLPADKRYVPCPNPSNLERKDLPFLHRQEYVHSPKLDGMRLFLVLGAMEFNDQTYSVFINRSYQVFPVSLQARHQELFDGTLLDGEMTREPSGAYKYTVFDAVTVEGYDLKAFPFSQRKDAYEGTVKNLEPPSGLILERKVWFPMAFSPQTWASVQNHCDGLILQPVKGTLKAGIQRDVFKWKPTQHQTIDFYLSRNGDGIVIMECGHAADVVHTTGLHCFYDTEAVSSFVIVQQRQVFECALNRVQDGKLYFIPVRLREDKVYANDARVVISTLEAIQDDINVEELCK
jgi:hypothetical protein